MGIMAKLIKQQPASRTETSSPVLPREYKCNAEHKMTTADAQTPATSGVGIILPPVGKCHQAMKQEEDPHVAKAFKELEALQQPGEPNQAYEQ